VIADPTWGLLEWLKGVSVGTLTLRATTTPSPQHRPRVGQHGTYYPKAYQIYHADCQKQFAAQAPKKPFTGLLACVVETVCKRPKKTKLLAPRGDSDNYAKAPLDAATKAGIYGDDAQVLPQTSVRRWAEPGEEPGVYLHIGELPT